MGRSMMVCAKRFDRTPYYGASGVATGARAWRGLCRGGGSLAGTCRPRSAADRAEDRAGRRRRRPAPAAVAPSTSDVGAAGIAGGEEQIGLRRHRPTFAGAAGRGSADLAARSCAPPARCPRWRAVRLAGERAGAVVAGSRTSAAAAAAARQPLAPGRGIGGVGRRMPGGCAGAGGRVAGNGPALGRGDGRGGRTAAAGVGADAARLQRLLAPAGRAVQGRRARLRRAVGPRRTAGTSRHRRRRTGRRQQHDGAGGNAASGTGAGKFSSGWGRLPRSRPERRTSSSGSRPSALGIGADEAECVGVAGQALDASVLERFQVRQADAQGRRTSGSDQPRRSRAGAQIRAGARRRKGPSRDRCDGGHLGRSFSQFGSALVQHWRPRPILTDLGEPAHLEAIYDQRPAGSRPPDKFLPTAVELRCRCATRRMTP